VCWVLQFPALSLVTDFFSSFRAFDSLLVFLDRKDIIQRVHELQAQGLVHFTRPDLACLRGSRKLLSVFTRAQFVCLFLARQPPLGQDLLIHEVSVIYNDAPQSVGLLWTSDQLVALTPT
jgi:hypothetical protein